MAGTLLSVDFYTNPDMTLLTSKKHRTFVFLWQDNFNVEMGTISCIIGFTQILYNSSAGDLGTL